MGTKTRYNFTLKAVTGDGNIFSRAVNPQYSKLALKYTLVSGEKYYDKKLDSEFIFVGDDFVFVHGLGIRTTFTMSVYEGAKKVVEGTFRKGDGKTDVDHKSFSVSLTLDDGYKKIKNGKNDEHDVIKMLKGEEVTANVKVYPLYQIYEYNQIHPNNVTHNLLNGTFTDFDVRGDSYGYETSLFNDKCAGSTDASLITDSHLRLGLVNYQAMHFMPSYCTMNITGSWGDYTVPAQWFGEYTNINSGQWEQIDNYKPNPWRSETDNAIKVVPGLDLNDWIYYLICRTILYKTDNLNMAVIMYMYLPAMVKDDNVIRPAFYSFEMCSRANAQSSWEVLARTAAAIYDRYTISSSINISEAEIHNADTLEYFGNDGTVAYMGIQSHDPYGNIGFFGLRGSFAYRSCFCRVLSYRRPALTYAFALDRSTDKIAPSSYAYRDGGNLDSYYNNVNTHQAIVASTRLSPNANRFNLQNNDGQYYQPPTDNEEYQPICAGAWLEGKSIWVKASLLQSLILSTVYTEPIEDFYELGDLIKRLLQKVDDSIVFEKDVEHSQFLFAANNPVTGLVNNKLLITQKSNLLRLHYDYPAWKGAITFEKLFSMLRNVFNCYYDIFKGNDGKWHLRIEHVLFYMNGLSYTPYSRNLINLKQWFDALNGKPQSFRSGNWQYDTATQASRYEFSWMDNQSDIFDGYPIIIPEEHMIFSEEKTEKCHVDAFSTDINFMLATSSDVSSDGFLLTEVVEDNGQLFVPEVTIVDAGRVFVVQNGNLSFVVLHPRYFVYNVYSKVVNINNGTMATISKVSRLRKNKVEFNCPAGVDITPHTLYRTSVGDGEVVELDVDLTSNKVSAELSYETETE